MWESNVKPVNRPDDLCVTAKPASLYSWVTVTQLDGIQPFCLS